MHFTQIILSKRKTLKELGLICFQNNEIIYRWVSTLLAPKPALG